MLSLLILLAFYFVSHTHAYGRQWSKDAKNKCKENLVKFTSGELEFDCYDIDAFSSILCSELIVQGDDDYEEARAQYASTSFPHKVMPSMILKAKHDYDIQLTILFAQQCNFKIIAKSGGHQYTGLSSCDGYSSPCIQIQMKYYDKIKTLKKQNHIRVGTGIEIHDLVDDYLAPNGLFLPHGDCPDIGMGGHIQTGGEGQMHNQFGFFLDHVSGFKIILADGSKFHVKKPTNWKVNVLNTKEDTIDPTNLNDLLYFGVLGGNPGSFGIITDWEFSALSDNDYTENVFYRCPFPFTGPILKAMMLVMKELYETDLTLLNTDYTFYLRQLKAKEFKIIFFIGNFVSTSGESVNMEYFHRFIDAANSFLPTPIECNPLDITKPSEYNTLLGASFEDIATFRTRMQATTLTLSNDFIEEYVNQMDILYNDDDVYNGVYIYSDIVYAGGNYFFSDPDPEHLRTSLPRLPNLQVNTDVYYNLTANENGEKLTEEWMSDSWELWFNTETYGFNSIDIRAFGTTFGNVNIEQVWPFYYVNSEELYNGLRQIKTLVDPQDIFSNSMTLNPFD